MRVSLLAWLGASILFAAPVVGLFASDHAAAGHAAPRDDDDDDEDERPNGVPKGKARGLSLTFRPAAAEGPSLDTRTARVAALYVPEGEPPSPFTPAGPFRATFEGEITVPFRTEATFSAEGRGSVEVLVNDKKALKGSDDLSRVSGKVAKLKKGPNKVVVTYDSPKDGDAVLRLYWESEDFGREPIPTVAMVHDPKASASIAGRRLREGRELMASLRCLKCHQAAEAASPGMPELALDAPDLAQVGGRLHADWMARWIADPKAVRPTATMPAMLHGATRAAEARDIAAYLATLTGGPTAPPATVPPPEVATAGGRLFARLGCVGCHTLPDRKDFAADPKRIPLRHVAAKWKPEALREFLKKPDRHFAWIRMPNFGLSDAEAANLAGYLTANSEAPTSEAGPAADPAHGKALFASTGCVHCHAMPEVAAPKALAYREIKPEGWARGCLAPEVGKAPDFNLTDDQKRAIRDFAKGGISSFRQDSAPEFAARQIKALRCEACHRRDGQDDAWTEKKSETAGLLAGLTGVEIDPDGHPYPAEEVRPSLTWAGEKLKPEWSAAFVAGEIPYKPRPYLHARMPAFPKRAAGIARGLAFEHGYPATSPPDPEPKAELVAAARGLILPTGLGCVTCHKLGDQAAVGVFEAPGVNFAHVRDRIRKPFYDRWIRSPLRVDPETKMPSFFNNGKSTLPTVFDGDAAKQAEALWEFLLQGEKVGPPIKKPAAGL